ncbi:MAG TPA: NADPH:quinone oxidoreductase [Microscillaceae bacterium]|nr:NADPH:quinone oxidoreductase [Microscillaceae bacterium]
MKAVIIKEFGGPEQLSLGEWEKPSPAQNEILVKVHTTALNRADTMQRRGVYPPPAGASPILGLEIAGEVAEVGTDVTQWKPGDRVFGLIPGGGYAEYAVIHQDMAMPIPNSFTFEQAVAVPEVFLTAYQAMKWLADIQSGETLLVHAGASGVGTAAIQLAKALGVKTIVTASAPKHQTCLDLGASLAIDYKTEDFKEKALEFTEGRGVDVIIDFIAAPYFLNNIDALATDGRMVILALMGGLNVDGFNLGKMLRKRLKVMGSTLRARSRDYQIRLNQDLKAFAIPLIEQGKIKPVIDSVFDWAQVAEAHEYMEANKNTGKIILKVS